MKIILLDKNVFFEIKGRELCTTDKNVGIGLQDVLKINKNYYRIAMEKGTKLGVRQIGLNFDCKSVKDKEIVCPMCGEIVREMVEYDRNKGITYCSTCKADLKFNKIADGYVTSILKRPNILKI